MRCFNHEEREAVATCQRCGKALCKECASKYSPCLCDECAAAIRHEQQQKTLSAEDQRRQKYKSALVDTKNEFIRALLLGVVIGLFFVWLGLQNDGFQLLRTLFYFVFGLSIPFGWKFLTFLQSFFPVTIFGTFGFWFAWIFFKAGISMLIGFPALIYQLIKTIRAQKEIDRISK